MVRRVLTLADIAREQQKESDAQRIVCRWLTVRGHCFIHVPNGGKRAAREAAIMKGLGVKPGVPDLLIFTPPPRDRSKRGTALELKRGKGGSLSPEQREWLELLRELGWEGECQHGSDAAIDWLESLGY